MKPSKQLTIVVPLLDEEESLNELFSRIDEVCSSNQLDYELIFIDDGSTDKSWRVITELSNQHLSVKGIKFQRNYGKSAALNIGFQEAIGDVVITMDADLQDNPDEIPDLVKMIKDDGYDLVSGWKKKRYDPILKTIPSKFFNFVNRKFSGIKLHDMNCGLKAYKNSTVKNIEVYGEMHRYIPVIAKWKGFGKIGEKEVIHQARKYGTSKFGFERFIYGFLDLLSITFVLKFKKRPMHFFGVWGSVSFFTGFAITVWLIIEKLVNISKGNEVREIVDQPLFFLSLVALIIGVQLFLAGFLGEIIALNNTKRNDYIIEDRI